MDGSAVFQGERRDDGIAPAVDNRPLPPAIGPEIGARTARALAGESLADDGAPLADHGPTPADPAPEAPLDRLGRARIRDEFQNERGIRVHIERARDAKLTAFGKATLADRYLMPGESYQDLFARVAAHFADDTAHAQRLYDYISRLWFMPATPVLSNGGTTRGLPISCFLNEAGDSLDGIVDLWNENVWLAARGGGIGSYWGNLRSIGERVGHNGKTSGVVPFIRVMDSLTLAISQGSLRRGSAAVYLPVSHPEIEEFVELCAAQPAATRTARRSICTTASWCPTPSCARSRPTATGRSSVPRTAPWSRRSRRAPCGSAS
jgi:ribonucleoside-diphosphate reductase alpha chain